MKIKTKIKYTPSELWKFFSDALQSILTGISRIVWSVILLVANIVLWLASELCKLIKKAPVLSVCITFVVMLMVAVLIHMKMKYKLTTAEWQRDSLEQRLDSIKVLYGENVTYFRYREYKEK